MGWNVIGTYMCGYVVPGICLNLYEVVMCLSPISIELHSYS